MTVFLQSNESPLSGGGNYFENDEIIKRPFTLGFLDFSHELCYSGGNPIPAYASLKNLVNSGTTANNGPNVRGIDGGMLKFNGATPDVNDYVTLPTGEFSLPTDCRRALVSVALKLPADGYGRQANTRYPLFFGRLNNTAPANVNFGIWGIVSPEGVLTSVQGAALGSVAISATSQLALLTDSKTHIVSVYADGETTPDVLITRIYVDNTLVATATNNAWDGIVPQPTNLPRLGGYPATIHSPWNNMQIGRPLIMDMTGSSMIATDIIYQQVALTAEFLE